MQPVGGRLAAIALAACLAACTAPTPPAGHPPVLGLAPMGLTPVAFADIPGWQQDHMSTALTALRRECAVLATMPADAELGGNIPAPRLGGRVGDWHPLCVAAASVAPGDDAGARAMLERELQPYAISNDGQSQGLFTGYYEPEVAGAMHRGGRYQTPLLRRPGDLVRVDLGDFSPEFKGHTIEGRVSGAKLVPYYDRAGIEAGALDAQKLALMYLADPIDAFVLQIQGSGRVRLPDGQIVRVNYDAQNGHPYVPIGRLLVERGALARDKVSMQSIRAWLESHPDQARALMDANPSYVFFRVAPGVPANVGAPGALEVPLTPERSLAVDRHFIPLAAPVFVATSNPLDGAPWQHLLLAQDIGGAIKGPVRGDIFFGWGAEAETLAGTMQQKGTAYLLLPRTAPGA